MTRFFAFMFAVGLMTIGLNTQSHAAPLQATVYQDPNCGCCAVYADYLIRRDVEVEVVESDQVVQMSRMTGIPEDMQGCHLTMIDVMFPLKPLSEFWPNVPKPRPIPCQACRWDRRVWAGSRMPRSKPIRSMMEQPKSTTFAKRAQMPGPGRWGRAS